MDGGEGGSGLAASEREREGQVRAINSERERERGWERGMACERESERKR